MTNRRIDIQNTDVMLIVGHDYDKATWNYEAPRGAGLTGGARRSSGPRRFFDCCSAVSAAAAAASTRFAGIPNIPVVTDMAGEFDVLPRYLKMPAPDDKDLAIYLAPGHFFSGSGIARRSSVI